MRQNSYHSNVNSFEDDSVDGVFFDPPYSARQIKECYEGAGLVFFKDKITYQKYFSECRDQIAKIIKPEGFAISFGWNSQGMGKKNGFKIIEILLVPHGGGTNDTIVVVDQKNSKQQKIQGFKFN